jgi:hypothetical protein
MADLSWPASFLVVWLQHRRRRVVVSGQSCCFRLADLEAPILSVGGVVSRFCVFCALPVFSDGILEIRRCLWWFRCGGVHDLSEFLCFVVVLF